MPAPASLLPIYGSHDSLLGYVSVPAALRMLDAGHAIGRGTKHRIRALIAVHDNPDLLPGNGRMPRNQKYSYTAETSDNPKGVWTFKRLNAR